MNTAMGLMAGKRCIVMGVANHRSIAWGVASALSDQGAELAFTYPDAFESRVRKLAEGLGSDIVLPCDVGDQTSIDETFAALAEQWEGIDFLVHAIAYSDK